MKTGIIIIFIISLSFMPSCLLIKKDKKMGKQLTIRYINIKAMFDFMLNRNKDALIVKNKRDEVIKTIKMLEHSLMSSDGNKEKLIQELNNNKKSLVELEQKSESYKNKLLNKINKAVVNVAKNLEIDYVLNIGDEVIYSKKEYDITEEVIREIIRLEKRSAPVSR